MASVDQDAALLGEVIGLFLVEAPVRMAKLRDSVVGGTPEEVQKAAHALKGMLLAVGATPAAEVALRLELMGRQADLRGATEAATELEGQLTRAQDAAREVQLRRAA
jgi:HPt (histidine-containing phosphotransfer) domain-containing protein